MVRVCPFSPFSFSNCMKFGKVIVIVPTLTNEVEISPLSFNLRVKVVGISAAKEPISMTALSTPWASALMNPSDSAFEIKIS